MPGTFDNSLISQVQQASDIIEIISEHVNLTKKGREMVGLCPFHDDHRPSMYVNGLKQIFKCFACGAGGSVFTFVQMRENLTFPQAIERLAERAGIKLRYTKTARDPNRNRPADIDPNELAKLNAWAAAYFQKNLTDKNKGKSARDYLAQRNISQQSIGKWRIGLAVSDNELLRQANTQHISTELLVKAGLVVKTASGLNDKFVNRLMFPITDVTSRVTGFGGRTLAGADAKYINSPGTVLFDKSNSLYGLEQARHQIVSTSVAVVVEGYTDCIMAHQFGCSNVVATLGTSFTTGHGRILRRYAKIIVMLFDNDTAGVEAANRAMEVCLSQRIDIKLASVPQGKDPCDFLLTAGAKKFQKLVNDAVDVFEFKWNRLVSNFGSDRPITDNRAAIEEFLQTIATALRAGNLAAIDRGLIVNRLSKIIGLDSKEINAELAKRIKRSQRAADYAYNIENQKVVKPDLGQGLSATAQREILEVLLNQPQLFKTVKGKIAVEDFDVPILSQIAAILFETLGDAEADLLAEVLRKAESTEMGGSLAELAQIGEQKGNFQSRLNGALDVMQRFKRLRSKDKAKTTKDQRQFLQCVYKNTGKQNPHSVGMV